MYSASHLIRQQIFDTEKKKLNSSTERERERKEQQVQSFRTEGGGNSGDMDVNTEINASK